jgi:hypothetical protein
MGCKVVFSSSAAKELQDSFVWYEKRAKGLGDRFINLIDLAIELSFFQ